MAKLIYNKNRFTHVDKYDAVNDSYNGILLPTKLNQKNGQDYKLLDAIDIDWNRAWFIPTASYINTTEELIEAIESLDNRSQVNIIGDQLEEIAYSYVTQEQLAEIATGLQGNLIAGKHIQITSDNIISAYGIITNDELYEFSQSYVSHSYFNENAYTKGQTYDLITQRIYDLVGNAYEAFDTLEEISYWIVGHNTEFERIDETIGHAIWNDTFQAYSYTGILKEINDLHYLDNRIINVIDSLTEQVTTASNYASMSYDTANMSYNLSNIAYGLAYEAYNSSLDSYAMAYYSYTAVGFKSTPGYFREMTDEERDEIEAGTNVYIYDESLHYYRQIPYVANDNIEYYIYVDSVEGTGLCKDVENALTTANTALYNLNVDNSNSSYVKLSLNPVSYNGDPSRTLLITTKEAQYTIVNNIIEIDGNEYDMQQFDMTKDGILTAYQINEILSYIFEIEKISSIH